MEKRENSEVHKEATPGSLSNYGLFLFQAVRLSFRGHVAFYSWMIFLTILSLIGLWAYCNQFVEGLVTTGMTDQVSWGVYIANFTFLVGMAAAAVMLVIPAYLYKEEEMHNIVIFGELFAVAVMIMCMLFVTVDMGRPGRFWHLIPVIGRFNFPISMLSWDVVALMGYLVINAHVCGYLLYMKYLGKRPNRWLFMPFVILSIVWAISIHTVTAFLYVGIAGRPFWNSAIVAPRFIASAFTAGPAFMIIAFQIIRSTTGYHIGDRVFQLLRQIVTISLLISLFLLGCEMFKEFYSQSLHNASARYLFFGLHGHYALVPWIWSAIAMEVAAVIILLSRFSKNPARYVWLNLACIMATVGIWIEKGPGLVIPGFLPTPLGEIVEYAPTLNETMVCVGIWAMGILLFSWMLRLAIPITSGVFHTTEDV
ncbi:MAG: polysulfide reductase [Candidatus Scalindua sp. AMX11]|nr:MAG: polysulfide reductase [Candidatus Scalindua sp.]NOG84267.1 polysulfide reductase NrfD [Planctomycetota bacterium]RZV68298.1 MAG: polysulfide reductase [Candidatus Scalindua sp. SCAELEC01]TDE63755.1 MAG: polysulfide reductase [Candidatus Scalindua sp. AMX11]GJQ60710.1 MAG: Hdr menaquinol oxidoreductase integral membrane subunit [Candidatus Scalindua sp.]